MRSMPPPIAFDTLVTQRKDTHTHSNDPRNKQTTTAIPETYVPKPNWQTPIAQTYSTGPFGGELRIPCDGEHFSWVHYYYWAGCNRGPGEWASERAGGRRTDATQHPEKNRDHNVIQLAVLAGATRNAPAPLLATSSYTLFCMWLCVCPRRDQSPKASTHDSRSRRNTTKSRENARSRSQVGDIFRNDLLSI